MSTLSPTLDPQIPEMIDALGGTAVRETADRVYFTVNGREKDVHKEFPVILIIETSSYCNLVCVGCPHKDMSRRRGFMDPRLFRNLVDEVADYDVRTWFHFLGEPLMHPDIFEMIEYAASRGLGYFGLSTNGILLTEENTERLLDSGLQRLEISLDSLDPELFAKLRPGGAPQRIIDNAHQFFVKKYARGQTHPVTSVSIRRMQENAHEIDSFVAHWRSILKEPDFVLAIAWNSWGGHEGLGHATYGVPQHRLPCLKLWQYAIVLQDGRLIACDGMYEGDFVMGDTNYETVHEIWNGERYREVRRRHLDGLAATVPVCGGCTDWYRELVIHDNLTGDGQTLEEIRDMVASGAAPEGRSGAAPPRLGGCPPSG